MFESIITCNWKQRVNRDVRSSLEAKVNRNESKLFRFTIAQPADQSRPVFEEAHEDERKRRK